jgi:hypothetical protein
MAAIRSDARASGSGTEADSDESVKIGRSTVATYPTAPLMIIPIASMSPNARRRMMIRSTKLATCQALTSLAIDRLVGLAGANKNIVMRMEERKLPVKMRPVDLDVWLAHICQILSRLFDRDAFPWLDTGTDPTDHERDRASWVRRYRMVRLGMGTSHR